LSPRPSRSEGVALAHEFAPDVVLIDHGTIEHDLRGWHPLCCVAVRHDDRALLGAHVTGPIAAQSIAAGRVWGRSRRRKTSSRLPSRFDRAREARR